MGRSHREALFALEWGTTRETSGLTLLVGEIGTGKTTLINAILAQAQHLEGVQIAFVLNPRLNIEEIMSLILRQLGMEGVRSSRLDLWGGFQGMIAGLKPGNRVAVIVDDAQDLSNERLEDLRLLSNCDPNGSKRLHFILVGQPELLPRLQSPALRNVNQRIGTRATLNPLEFDEARDYVDYLLRQKGGS